MNDHIILKNLSWQYLQMATEDINTEKAKLHYAVNDLKMIRPVVLIDELPWHEMNINNELTLQCVDPYFREVELFIRRSMYKKNHLPADMILQNYLPVHKIISSTGIGIEIEEHTLSTNQTNPIVSHTYHDILKNDEDLAKIHNPVITYHEKETLERFNMLGEIVGDIIPIKLVGMDYYPVVTWDDVARYRGVTNLLMDLIERPNFMHKIVRKLTDVTLSVLEQYETLDLFETTPTSLHCTPILTKDLPAKNSTGASKITRKDIWGRGAAQIFASVSKAMHNEFDIEYMKETIGQCGLSYYGCCEPLDTKIDIVKTLPNLRKISITPWANVEIAAEAICKDYVLSSKPNPASVAISSLDKAALKKEIQHILKASAKNNCNIELVLKDISTCSNNPNNLFEWEKIVMDLVTNYV